MNTKESKSKKVIPFCCEKCAYTTSRKSQYDRHLSTDKHKKRQNDSKMVVNGSEKLLKVAQYKCDCGKIYKYDSCLLYTSPSPRD